jgi:L-ascorbate metabolism protein UlaG (beta-lactamase superfamily)
MSNIFNTNANDLVFLSPETKMEPLMCRWYAWGHMISPAQLALHIEYRLLPLLRSFATNPSVHVSANTDPSMYGGPFMSLREEDAQAVQALIEHTTSSCADLITLAKDLRAVAATIEEKANGYSLNEFYATLPPSLQGLVEYLYDANSHASIRLFEDLLYDEDLTGHAQEVMLQTIGERDRHFFMSTPRMPTTDSLSFKIRFSDKRLDTLFAMRTRAGSFAEIAKLFEVGKDDMNLFRSFFSVTAPAVKAQRHFDGDGVRMRFFGHACVLFQTTEVAVLFDPFVGIEPGSDNRLILNDLPDFIDYVVLTHNHQDHFSAEMLIQLRHRIGRVIVPANNSGSITDPSMVLTLRELGFDAITALQPFETVKLPDGKVMSLPFTGEHADLNIYSKQAVSLTLKGRKFMFLVDSDGRDKFLYQRMMRRVGKIDALFLGMECNGAPLNWLYEPLMNKPLNRRNNESRRLSGADCLRASNILSEVEVPQVFVYAMGQDPWMNYIMGLEYAPDSIQLTESNAFIERCNAAGIRAGRLWSGDEEVYTPIGHVQLKAA